MYAPGEYDLCGTIVGVVDRKKMIDGSRIAPGDVIIGLPSNGLHTNGYSLARKIFFDHMQLSPAARLPGLAKPLGEELLRVHINYQPLLASFPHRMIKGLAHITGGGLVDNIPRVLPKDCDARIETNAWKIPAIFEHLRREGAVPRAEMYQVFNMGIGMVMIVARKDAAAIRRKVRGLQIGSIERGSGVVQLAL
jgi:phosphoribosylformylglycinamidine cyclo-ligase